MALNILTDDGAVDSSSAYGNFFILIMSGLAEMERENILAQTFAGRVEKARQGRFNGGQAPYGYRIRQTGDKKEKGILEINEDEAPLIRLIYDRYVYHEKGDGKVANYLITHGYNKTVRQNGNLVFIDESFVGHVIRNELYTGTMVYGKRKNSKDPNTGKILTRMRDKSEWYRSEGLHEPIISKELFEKAQKIRERNTHNQPKLYNPEHAAIFSGLLFCPVCGAPMHGVGGMGKVKLDGKYGGGQYYYNCSNHRRRHGEYQCQYSKGWRQDKIDALMADIIVQIAGNDAFRKDISGRIGKAVDTTEYEAQAERIKRQIRNKTKTLKKKALLIDDFDWDVENADSIYEALNGDYVKLQNEVASLEKSLSGVEDTVAEINNEQITKDNVYKFLLEFGMVYKDMKPVQKKELANRFIERIEIYPEEKEDGSVIRSITFRFPLFGKGKRLEMASGDRPNTSNQVETVALLTRI